MGQTRRKLLLGGTFLGAALGGLLPATCAWQQIRRESALPQNGAPQRPSGHAKPLLEEDIAPVPARIHPWYPAHPPADKFVFHPPATDADLDAFERLVGFKMPKAYRQLYRWHDGEEDDR